MRQVNVHGLDLNLVPALEALLRLRNVTQAAAEVGMSQPAMSRALARLRNVQGDPLLVRTRAGYALTPRALAIQPDLELALHHLRGVFQDQVFDPGSERRTVRLAASDAQNVLLMPGLMRRLAREAPGVAVRAEPYSANLWDRLESGALDFTFALSSTPMPPGSHSEVVADDRLALVMRQDHPAAGKPWTFADYGAFGHVGVALLGDAQSQVDAELAAQGVSRRMALVTPHFMAALAAVASTDLVTTISAALARRFQSTFGLALREPPFGETRLQITLVSSHIRTADPFVAWFRGIVQEAAAEAMGA